MQMKMANQNSGLRRGAYRKLLLSAQHLVKGLHLDSRWGRVGGDGTFNWTNAGMELSL